MIDQQRTKILSDIQYALIDKNIVFKKIDYKKIDVHYTGDIDFLADCDDNSSIEKVIIKYCTDNSLSYDCIYHVSTSRLPSRKFIIYDLKSKTLPLQIDINYSFHWLCFDFFDAKKVLSEISGDNKELKDKITNNKNIFYKKEKNFIKGAGKQYYILNARKIILYFMLLKLARKNLIFRFISLFFFIKNVISCGYRNAYNSRMIAFYGADGAGKTTLINAINDNPIINAIYDEVIINHTRPKIIPSISELLRREKASRNVMREHRAYSILKAHIVLCYYFFDYFFYNFYIARYFSRKKRLIIFDRYFHEYSYQPSYKRLNPFLIKVLQNFIPKPNINFYITGDAEVISRRKDEVTAEFVQNQYELYLRNVQTLSKVETFFINTTGFDKQSSSDVLVKKVIEI